ncbi:acyl-CoA N-acyltransferase [Xylariaceae sp. FL1019]|nr:acyl-CoA N-acyltransferase [Xylariaceae sp. FL1019]
MASINICSTSGFNIRTHVAGDMGMIVSRHGSLYAREFGWTTAFESITARLVSDILDNFDPDRERVFIGEAKDTKEFLGSIALLKHRQDKNAAQIRLLLVDPAARGTGLGAGLVREGIAFAREKGYAKIILWTFGVLEGARRLYKREGFELTNIAEEKEKWGTPLAMETWELRLEAKA